MLEQGSNHSVANHGRGDLESLQLQRSQSRSLMVRSSLCEVSSVELSDFMKVRDETQGSSVALEVEHSATQSYVERHEHTDVANEPVLHTVKTLRVFGEEGCTRLISQSPPHLAMALLRPTSSSAMSFPSLINASTIARGLSFAEMESSSNLVRRRVAFPRFTAVGRAV